MNKLAERFGDKVAICGFFCNQFGHQTNDGNAEVLNTLKYVRPGDGFEPAPSITLFEKTNVNGKDASPLFKWLKSSIPIPCDVGDSKGNGVDDRDVLITARESYDGTTVALWSPVCRSDIAWNYEKFLIGPDGQPSKRYGRFHAYEPIGDDIAALL